LHGNAEQRRCSARLLFRVHLVVGFLGQRFDLRRGRRDRHADARRELEGDGCARVEGGERRAEPGADGALVRALDCEDDELVAAETCEHVRLAEGDAEHAGERGERTVAGLIEISEPLDAERRAARTIVSDTLLTTLTLIVVCGALSGVLGLWLVGRPVRLLCEKARRIGEGDFGGPLVLGERDELGMLAAEMNATCGRLNAAAVRVDRETAARIAALEQLRHVDRLTTVGRLASGVAHELGTPLNVVAARAKMIAFVMAERGRKRSAFSSRTPRRACSRSPKTTTWVFAIDEVLWLFLQRARGARPLFDDVVRLRPWREEQIIALLRARTATTTLQPSFERLLDKLLPVDLVRVRGDVRIRSGLCDARSRRRLHRRDHHHLRSPVPGRRPRHVRR